MREGFKRPKDDAKFVEMIRKDPRVIQPELHVEWLPRYKQGDDGHWRLEEQKNRSTVRHGVRRTLRDELLSETNRIVREHAHKDIRQKLGEPVAEVPGIEEAMKLAFRSERILAKTEQDNLGISDWTLGPEWSALHQRGSVSPGGDDGHWLRAPFEFGKPHTDGLRTRIVELRIDDLSRLLEQFGTAIEFWLIKDSPKGRPRWTAVFQHSFLEEIRIGACRLLRQL